MTRPNWAPVAVGAVAAVGLAVRLYDPDTAAVTNDEAYSWRIAQYPVADLIERARGDANPPLYYLLLKAWVAVAGDSLASMRGLAAAFGALTVAAVAAFVAELGGRRAWGGGLAAAALVAVHPLQTTLGRSARAYAPALFLAVVSSYLLWRAVREGKRRWWVGYGVAAGLFALTHHYALFTLAAHALFVAGSAAAAALRREPGAGRLVGRAALGSTVALAVYLPWLGGTLEQVHSVKTGFWIPELTAATAAEHLAGFVTGLTEAGGAELAIAAAIAAVVLVGLVGDRGRGGAVLLLMIVVPWAAAVGLSLATGRSILVDRYLAFAQLFFLCAVGRLAWAVPNRAVALGLVALAAGLLAAETQSTLAEPADPGGNLTALGQALATEPDTVVYSANPGEACQVLYYARRSGSSVAIKVVGWPPKPGGAHKTHATAIPTEDWIAPGDLPHLPGPTVTVVVQTANTFLYADNWSIRSSRRFIDHGARGWIVNEMAVAPPAPGSDE